MSVFMVEFESLFKLEGSRMMKEKNIACNSEFLYVYFGNIKKDV